MNKKRISLEEHTEFANDLAIAHHYLNKLFFAWQERKGKSHLVCKVLLRFIKAGGYLSVVQNEMDIQFHKDISDKEFIESGHVYYGLEGRYESVKEKGNG